MIHYRNYPSNVPLIEVDIFRPRMRCAQTDYFWGRRNGVHQKLAPFRGDGDASCLKRAISSEHFPYLWKKRGINLGKDQTLPGGDGTVQGAGTGP